MPSVCVQSGSAVQCRWCGPGPDIQEDQGPEVHDRQPVGVNRPARCLRNEVVHHSQEARRQEEAHRVVAIPPLHQRILHARIGRVAFGGIDGDRDRRVIDDVQHRDGDDERQKEPVRHIDMRLGPFQDRAQEDQQVANPDNRQPQVDVPFRFGVFLALAEAHDIAERGHDDKELVAPEDEIRQRLAAEQAGPAGALHDVERCSQQRGSAKGEDRRRGVDRAQAAKVGEGEPQI